MRVVQTFLPMTVGPVAAHRIGSGVRLIFRAAALLRCSSLDQRAVHRKVMVSRELLCARVHLGEETLRHLGRQQAVAVLGEHLMVPHRIVHA